MAQCCNKERKGFQRTEKFVCTKSVEENQECLGTIDGVVDAVIRRTVQFHSITNKRHKGLENGSWYLKDKTTHFGQYL